LDFDGEGFEWIDCHNWEASTFAFIRKAKQWPDFLVILCNFTPVTRTMKIGVPLNCYYQEIFSSDSIFYGGSNTGNGPGIQAANESTHGRPATIEALFPPLAISILKPKL
jgi:1,4-alpha-glucan branching enzyme